MKIHVVQRGETLWDIAAKHNVDVKDVIALNPQLSSPDMIMPGMKIKIPMNQTKQNKEVLPEKENIVKGQKKNDKVKEIKEHENKDSDLFSTFDPPTIGVQKMPVLSEEKEKSISYEKEKSKDESFKKGNEKPKNLKSFNKQKDSQADFHMKLPIGVPLSKQAEHQPQNMQSYPMYPYYGTPCCFCCMHMHSQQPYPMQYFMQPQPFGKGIEPNAYSLPSTEERGHNRSSYPHHSFEYMDSPNQSFGWSPHLRLELGDSTNTDSKEQNYHPTSYSNKDSSQGMNEETLKMVPPMMPDHSTE